MSKEPQIPSEYDIKRRQFMQQLASLGVIGAINSLYSFPAHSSSVKQTPLQNSITGNVISKIDDNYESLRQSMVWHVSKPARYPDWIVQAQSEQDVITTVNYARANKLKIASRSSGHNSTGTALRDNSILLDVSRLNSIQIEDTNKTASVGPGVLSVVLLANTLQHNLAFPAAHCPSVAMGGYLLGGGMGWNHAYWGGLACHSVLSADVILANGDKVTASPTSYPDLYWAIKGAGPGFFGVISHYELQLYPAPKTIMGSMFIHSLDNLDVVTATLDDLVKVKDQRIEILMVLMHNAQASEDTPPEQAKICFVGVNAFADSEEEAKQMLAPFNHSPLATQSIFKQEDQLTDFNKLYNPQGVDTGSGRYAVDNIWTHEPAKALTELAEHFKSSPSERSHVLASYSIDTTPRADAAFSADAHHYIASYLVWNQKKDDEANHAWLKTANDLLAPYSKGNYINEVAADRHPERVKSSFSLANWERLQQLRKKYDPNNVFHTYLGHS